MDVGPCGCDWCEKAVNRDGRCVGEIAKSVVPGWKFEDETGRDRLFEVEMQEIVLCLDARLEF